MSRGLANRIERLEATYNILEEDEGDSDPRYEWQTAADAELAHLALLALILTDGPSPQREARIAEAVAAYIPGQRRVRRLREPAQQWLDAMLAGCPFDL